LGKGSKGEKMNVKGMSAMLMAGIGVVAVMAAPAAQARPTCQQTDFKSICQTNGSVSIKARPGTVAPPANMPMIPWLGAPGARR
jgi:hypothetical protein